MLAWSRQDESIMRDLETKGVYYAGRDAVCQKYASIAPYYLSLYDWYIAEAEKASPRPRGASYPIWLFLNKQDKLPLLEGTVVLELDIPREYITITDVSKWDFRVNYLYIPLDADDARRHDEELRRLGIVNETALINSDLGNYYPHLKRKIIASWTRLFEPPRGEGSVLQGTVWELRREWIRRVERRAP